MTPPEGSAPKRWWTCWCQRGDAPEVVVPESALREEEESHLECHKTFTNELASAFDERDALKQKLAEAEAEAAQWKRLFRTLEDLREREKAKP